MSNAESHVYQFAAIQSSLLIEITEVVLINVTFVANDVDVGSIGAVTPEL